MCRKTYGVSHRGLVRTINEDRQIIKSIGEDLLLMAVADGLGGGVCGTQAAEITISELSRMEIDGSNILRSLGGAIQLADNKIRWIVSQNEKLEGMGSTLTAVLVDDKYAHWVNVGDSRLYRLRQGVLEQMTTDQNMAQFLVEEGELTNEEARFHPSQNQLDQCIGCGDCIPDTGFFPLCDEDLLILTTDGLHGELSGDVFAGLVHQDVGLAAKGEALLDAALQAGGRDNITLVMGQI
jgi:PPM family protein phosphatase